MNFLNRLVNTSFSSVPVSSPASSTSSSSPSRSLFPSSTAISQNEDQPAANINPLNLFGRNAKRITSLQNSKANNILSRLYPQHFNRGSSEYSAIKGGSPSQIPSQQLTNIDFKEDIPATRRDLSMTLITSVTTEESSLSLDLNLIHSTESIPSNKGIQQLFAVANHENDDSTSEEDMMQVVNEVKKHKTEFMRGSPLSPPNLTSAKISRPSTATSTFPSDPSVSSYRQEGIPITKNLKNTNSVLINRKEFDALLTQKLEIEQAKLAKQSHSHLGLLSTFSPSDKPPRKIYSPYFSHQISSLGELEDGYTPIFYCPEGITRIPFHHDSAEWKKISKSARLSSLYLKYEKEDDNNYDTHIRSTSNSTAVTTESTISDNRHEGYKQRMLKRQYMEIDQPPFVYDDVPPTSDECGPTPTNSPNSILRSRKYFK